MSRGLPNQHRYLHRIPPTPLVPVALGDHPPIWCKLEFLNPSGSTKDRIARHILEKACRQGKLNPGDTVIEASSGSTSIAMALACAQLGLKFIAVMPEGVSNERTFMIRAYGGVVMLTPKAEGIRGTIDRAVEIAAERGAFLPRQFSNPDNAEAHRIGTAREILDQIPDGAVDVVASGVGTGGTLVGLYQGLTDGGASVTPVVARPVSLYGENELECCSFSSQIPGVVDSISEIFSEAVLPGLTTIEVKDDLALDTARQLIAAGFPVGPSSGLNYVAAVEARKALSRPDAVVVTVFPDRMERYFTTELFRPLRCGDA
ncbi:MAG: cysteine synthase family protein [Gemmataceae bacterium]|nr:cysteine synthase family protein [Gemmataceae bacterium]